MSKKQNQTAESTDTYQLLPVDVLFLSNTNPRRARAGNDAFNELVESIKQICIINPITVRRKFGVINLATETEIDPYYEVVSGSRRFLAAQDAELKEVPCIIKDLTDQQVLEIQIIENLQREDIHPLDEAAAFKHLLDIQLYNPELIAQRIGKSVSYVYKRLQLLNLDEGLKKEFYEGKLNLAPALHIARLTKENQIKLTKYWRNIGNTSITDIKNEIERRFHLSLEDAVFDKTDRTLIKGADNCINCPKRSGYNPQLFDDIAKDDICTDGECFDAKVKANIAREISNAASKGDKLIPISTYWHVDVDEDNNPGVLSSNDYEVYDPNAHESEDGFVDAIYIDSAYGNNGIKAGNKVKIRVTKKSEANEDDLTPEEIEQNAAEKAKEAKRIEKENFDREVNKRVNEKLIDETLRLVPIGFDELLLDLILEGIKDGYYANDMGELLERHGFDEDSNEYNIYEEDLRGYIYSFPSLKDKFKTLLEYLLLNDVGYAGRGKTLNMYVEQYGIDQKGIKRETAKTLRAEIKEQQKNKIPDNNEAA